MILHINPDKKYTQMFVLLIKVMDYIMMGDTLSLRIGICTQPPKNRTIGIRDLSIDYGRTLLILYGKFFLI